MTYWDTWIETLFYRESKYLLWKRPLVHLLCWTWIYDVNTSPNIILFMFHFSVPASEIWHLLRRASRWPQPYLPQSLTCFTTWLSCSYLSFSLMSLKCFLLLLPSFILQTQNRMKLMADNYEDDHLKTAPDQTNHKPSPDQVTWRPVCQVSISSQTASLKFLQLINNNNINCCCLTR